MATTFNVISLGTFLNLDAVEGGQPENAPRLNNQTFGGQDNPLYNNIQTFAPAGAGPSGGGNPTQYEGDGDFDQFAINGGPVKTVEAFIFMPATITYIDGTTTTISGRVMQSTDLQLYLVPSISQDLSQDALEAKPILSITFGTFVPPPQNQTYVMQADRDPNELVPVVDGTSGDDVMNVGFADQTNRNAAAPRIDGNANYILAGGGNDFVAGGGGNDTIYGGDGNDTIQGGTGADALFGGAGADTLDYSDNNQAVSVNLANNTVSGGTAQGDTINGFENVVGGSGNDTLVLSNTAGSASGGAGSDTITGGSANDTLNGEAGNDVLRGGDGADRLFGGADHDTLYGDAGNDVLDGGTGNDRLFGGAGNDVLLGGAGNDTLDGGAGTDTLTGGDGADVFIADGTADLITDFGVGGGPINDDDPTNNDFVDLSAFYNPTTLAAWNAANPDRQFDKVLTWLRADYMDNGVLDQAGGLRIQNGAGALVGADALNFETTNVCFTTGTLITTPNGPVAIENLRIGDLVATADRGACAIRWIGSSRVGSVALAMNPKKRPVRIKSGALGRGLPQGDLLVSQQHRIMVHSPILEKMVGAKEGLVAAKHLVGMPGIDLADDVVAVTYWHFLLDRHEIVFAQGAAAESLFTGPVALQSVPAASRDEILALFPELAALDYTALAATAARPLINGRLGRTLVERHKKNAKHLVG